MKITIKAEAAAVINEIAKFVESKNTKGSGNRFAVKFLKHLTSTLKTHHKHSLCKFPDFASRDWKCFVFNNWIVAYEVQSKKIEVKVIIHGSLLNY